MQIDIYIFLNNALLSIRLQIFSVESPLLQDVRMRALRETVENIHSHHHQTKQQHQVPVLSVHCLKDKWIRYSPTSDSIL